MAIWVSDGAGRGITNGPSPEQRVVGKGYHASLPSYGAQPLMTTHPRLWLLCALC